jgi:excisionase family DNA binding protein
MLAKLLSVEDVADLLRVSKFTVYSWVAQGRIPCVKLGTRTMFVPQEVQRWVDAHSRPEATSRTMPLATAR